MSTQQASDRERPGFSDEDVARYWDQNADLWSDHVRRGWDAYREHYNNPAFLAFLGDVVGKAVLDAGCGEGRNTRILARQGAHVVGVDISPRMIGLAREEEGKEPLGIHYEIASYSDLSLFPDASFDLVVSSMALMDGPDYEGAIREFFRLLGEHGELVFSISHPCFMTRGFAWERDAQGNRVRLLVADYFDDEPWVERWSFSKSPLPEDPPPFAVPTFPRILSYYLNTLIRSGFVLREVHEPRPSEEMCREHPWLSCWRRHAPLFLYVRGAKP